MKRDMALVRQLLLLVEQLPYPNLHISLKCPGYQETDIAEHVTLLQEAGLLVAESLPISCFYEWNNVRVTWAGHEFLAVAHDEQRWQTVTQALQQELDTFSFELLHTRLIQAIQQQLDEAS